MTNTYKINRDCKWFLSAHGVYPDFCGLNVRHLDGNSDMTSCHRCYNYEVRKPQAGQMTLPPP